MKRIVLSFLLATFVADFGFCQQNSDSKPITIHAKIHALLVGLKANDHANPKPIVEVRLNELSFGIGLRIIDDADTDNVYEIVAITESYIHVEGAETQKLIPVKSIAFLEQPKRNVEYRTPSNP